MEKRLISIVIPAYNEEDCIDELTIRLKSVMNFEDNYDFEVVIVENGSSDSTWDKLVDINRNDKRFKIIKLARNFLMDGGLTAGLDYISGDAVVLMTADLQDPPEFIPKLIREWELGWENIYGLVTKRNGTGPIRTFNSKLFYLLANSLSDGRLPKNASDFRLADRKVYMTVRQMKERNRFVRGLFAWPGFKTKGISLERPPRFGGKSKAHTFKVLDLAFKGIFAHSYKPLKFITGFGIFLSFVSFVSLLPLTYLWVFHGVPFAGFGTLVGILMLLISFLFFTLGIIGEYIALIYEEVKSRPIYAISEVLGFTEVTS